MQVGRCLIQKYRRAATAEPGIRVQCQPTTFKDTNKAILFPSHPVLPPPYFQGDVSALALSSDSQACLFHFINRVQKLNLHGESEVTYQLDNLSDSVNEITGDSDWQELQFDVDHPSLANADPIPGLKSADSDILIM